MALCVPFKAHKYWRPKPLCLLSRERIYVDKAFMQFEVLTDGGEKYQNTAFTQLITCISTDRYRLIYRRKLLLLS